MLHCHLAIALFEKVDTGGHYPFMIDAQSKMLPRHCRLDFDAMISAVRLRGDDNALTLSPWSRPEVSISATGLFQIGAAYVCRVVLHCARCFSLRKPGERLATRSSAT